MCEESLEYDRRLACLQLLPGSQLQLITHRVCTGYARSSLACKRVEIKAIEAEA